MTRQCRPCLAENPGDCQRAVNDWHVTRLTAALVRVATVAPLEERHLLRKAADDASIDRQGLCAQRVTTGAQFRPADVFTFRGLKATGGTTHDPAQPGINGERSVLQAAATLCLRKDELSIPGAFVPQAIRRQ